MNPLQRLTAFAILPLSFLVGQAVGQLSVLYSFTGLADGNQPNGVIADGAGNLYGTTSFGGINSDCAPHGCGSVFELSPGAEGWKLTTLYSFTGQADGEFPVGNLAMDQAGNLYGVTFTGGAYNCGVTFELSPTTAGWRFIVIHPFNCFPDGAYPYSGLTLDSSGNLYGTTSQGGLENCQCGVVFELSPGVNGWTETPIHIFNIKNGSTPEAAVAFDGAGHLYSTAIYGGEIPPSYGMVFELSPTSSGGWGATFLHGFTDGHDGWDAANLVLDSTGNIYGTTQFAGRVGWCNGLGCGVVFELVRASNWKETELHTFSGGYDGVAPNSLIMEAAGNLYGTTAAGGDLKLCNTGGCGVLFKVSDESGNWKQTVLHTFAGTDGEIPSSVIVGADGNLYGTTQNGGVSGWGTIFQYKP